MLKALVLVGVLVPSVGLAANPAPMGFTCTTDDGPVRRLNIDLKRGRYDDGKGVRRVDRITDTTIVIKGPNPDLAAGDNPLGPILSSLELNRTSLVLTDRTLMPSRGIDRSITYRCQMGPAIDFAAGRRF